jgi:hypothetical protein
MWCTTCQQEVPGVSHAATGHTVCSRCQRPKPKSNNEPQRADHICDDGIALDEPAAALAAAAAPLSSRDWANQSRVRSLGRELRRPPYAVMSSVNSISFDRHRLDPPQNLFDPIEPIAAPPIPSVSPAHAAASNGRRRRSEKAQMLAWLVVLAGAIILMAGIGLITWSLYAKQLEFWNLAIGLALGGQGTLILGLVLVVSRLWRNSRYAANKLHDVHTRLGQLQHTADALAAMRAGGAPAFYADLVRGASPQVLLANLKGQLDQLATRIGSG